MSKNEVQSYINCAAFVVTVVILVADGIRIRGHQKQQRETYRKYKAEQKKFDLEFEKIVSASS